MDIFQRIGLKFWVAALGMIVAFAASLSLFTLLGDFRKEDDHCS